MTPLTTPLSSARYCRGCGYDLRATAAPRCPECGRGFDPADPRTTRPRPLRRWLRHVRRAAYALGTLTLLLAALWLWFFWGWYDEQRALAALHPSYQFADPLSPRLRAWPGGFVFDRVVVLNCSGLTDLAPVARLHRLRELSCDRSPVRDLRPLTELVELRFLDLSYTAVTDLTPLAGLKNLEFLVLLRTPVTDLIPLAGLTRLRSLHLIGTPIRDITPLAGLKEVSYLDLRGTRITDVRPLEHLGRCKQLALPKETITEEQAESLRRALPGSEIGRR